jgi:hypothetical protein
MEKTGFSHYVVYYYSIYTTLIIKWLQKEAAYVWSIFILVLKYSQN